uniref:Uncharacterized protein n=1 Tax=Physcomitrium patens TaxID=3218 RepID=A0A2K1KL75_PHYPA|nr:hypothetical protein PHYPA_008207 [Physcomitrium patens]
MYHKLKKSKVFIHLKKKTDIIEEDFKPIKKLIGEAFKIIDNVSSLHRNKARHQKSSLSGAKRTMMI